MRGDVGADESREAQRETLTETWERLFREAGFPPIDEPSEGEERPSASLAELLVPGTYARSGVDLDLDEADGAGDTEAQRGASIQEDDGESDTGASEALGEEASDHRTQGGEDVSREEGEVGSPEAERQEQSPESDSERSYDLFSEDAQQAEWVQYASAPWLSWRGDPVRAAIMREDVRDDSSERSGQSEQVDESEGSDDSFADDGESPGADGWWQLRVLGGAPGASFRTLGRSARRPRLLRPVRGSNNRYHFMWDTHTGDSLELALERNNLLLEYPEQVEDLPRRIMGHLPSFHGSPTFPSYLHTPEYIIVSKPRDDECDCLFHAFCVALQLEENQPPESLRNFLRKVTSQGTNLDGLYDLRNVTLRDAFGAPIEHDDQNRYWALSETPFRAELQTFLREPELMELMFRVLDTELLPGALDKLLNGQVLCMSEVIPLPNPGSRFPDTFVAVCDGRVYLN